VVHDKYADTIEGMYSDTATTSSAGRGDRAG
jgi:hypothetical protein